jgi:hypothetical protein
MIRASSALVLACVFTSASCSVAREGERGAAEASSERAEVPPMAPPADVVVAWNALLLDAAEAEDGFLTLKGVRSAAMMHLAMHDALALADGRAVDPVAVASEAAYTVAMSQYPDREADLSAERARWAVEGGDPAAADTARSVGARAAEAVLAARAHDGWDAEPTYTFHPMAPGVYAEFKEHSATPEGFVFGAGWALARPFVLDSASQFRSPPPPAVDSDAYTRDFDEVKHVGALRSATRTAEQAHLAMWWKQFVEKSHNRLARELVVERGLGLGEAARLFALLNVSVFDGYVASFDGKFHYNHWRPYTAIRWAAEDGNPDTEADTAWTNLHDHTYAFPSYPSAHGTVCAAAMTVMADTFGEDVPFEMTIREADVAGPMSGHVPLDPATRSFTSFDEAAEECALSRVYLGIHFRYDSEAGTVLGRRIGEMAVRDFLPPTR